MAQATEPTSVIGTRIASPASIHAAVARPMQRTAADGVLMLGWIWPARCIDQAAASQGKQQPAGGYEISVEAFEQRQQRGREDDVDDPARAHCALEGNRGHELLAGQSCQGAAKATAAMMIV
jgi:hypothetical protein